MVTAAIIVPMRTFDLEALAGIEIGMKRIQILNYPICSAVCLEPSVIGASVGGEMCSVSTQRC